MTGAADDPVGTALDQLAQAQSALFTGTWGEGNVGAGIVAIAPQLLIATAQLSLLAWQDSNQGAQTFFARSEGTPIVHGIARLSLGATVLLPTIAQASMGAAQQILPVVGLFGGQSAAVSAYAAVADAHRNGMVYATVPVSILDTQPIVYISVNGGDFVPVILDTGSIGLLISRDYVGQQNLGAYQDDSTTCVQQSGDHCSAEYGYAGTPEAVGYDVYTTTVDFGNGIVTDPTHVGIVTEEDSAAFITFLGDGVVGVLGVGPNSYGPLTSSVTSALPGMLSTGMLLNERGGYLTLGPNPLPARATLDGTPHTPIVLKFDDGDPESVSTGSFDSGGVYGAISQSLIPADGLPAGTMVWVYTADGKTLLYHYRINEYNALTVADRPDYFNAGVEAFLSGPIYVDFSGNGSTQFDYRWL
ncbi:PecA family PE domain-processing aspartic protease [Mycobacterium sp. CVI_P3]|uniref:PecA family PE domain-processing aspartic protease n=1 Tax=Mycobacterium pinniadriaticum TaxID=2994102 RepID=A0ABT3SK47_9MYCO|nr:PecA family PE domain-processing aspartic protease [Mycobacterium pinniadriaticum]MCX2933458.1 PecA family PE domain-processing aspartic protease [Mycobacterium pinniadriaticum]MCX2939903.1 PecA family PE domain-processing aspartic protease [Mycobacterium pinniadriaticum]